MPTSMNSKASSHLPCLSSRPDNRTLTFARIIYADSVSGCLRRLKMGLADKGARHANTTVTGSTTKDLEKQRAFRARRAARQQELEDRVARYQVDVARLEADNFRLLREVERLKQALDKATAGEESSSTMATAPHLSEPAPADNSKDNLWPHDPLTMNPPFPSVLRRPPRCATDVPVS